MSRLSIPLTVTFSLFLCSPAFSQTSTGGTPVRPGAATTAPLPGMPGGAQAQAGTARLRGRVVAAQTGAPLRRAQVSLGSPASPTPTPRTASTDSDGRFEFTQLPPGRYSVIVNKTGYVALQYGQKRPTDPMTMVTLADGERRDDVNVALPRGGVIAVRITDDYGDPLPGAQVQVQRYQFGPDGQRRLNTVFGGLGPNTTDDRGEARMYGLPAGDYVVSAMLRNVGVGPDANAANADGFAATFHPGTINPNDAATVTVSLGEETSIEFAMSSARLARVSGTVVDSRGRPASGSFVQVVNRQGNGMFSVGGNQVAPDGTFTLNGIAPGDYSLEVRTNLVPGVAADGVEFGSTPITVAGAEITGVRIVTGKGATITGRVIFEGTAPRQNPRQPLRVFPNPADPSRSSMVATVFNDPRTNGTVDENGNFQLAGLSGRVFLIVSAAGFVVKSITLDGEDITDEPLDLTGKQSIASLVIRVTDKLTQISGQVSDSRGQRPRECTVVFQSAEAREPVVAARLLRTVRCDSMGSFQMRGMRPGRYVVTAITSIDQGRQFEPEFQEQLRRASESFTVREGEMLTLDLKLSGL
jgi:protocatechuate 3,4-dioxygenase beta subunit